MKWLKADIETNLDYQNKLNELNKIVTQLNDFTNSLGSSSTRNYVYTRLDEVTDELEKELSGVYGVEPTEE